MTRAIDASRLVKNVINQDLTKCEEIRGLAQALIAASRGDYRATLSEAQVKLLGQLADEAGLDLMMMPQEAKPDEQRSSDGYGPEDWNQC